MLVVGFVVVAAALVTEVMYQPPYWVHAVLWLPLIGILAISLLRPFKATLVALQYRHEAEEGKPASR